MHPAAVLFDLEHVLGFVWVAEPADVAGDVLGAESIPAINHSSPVRMAKDRITADCGQCILGGVSAAATKLVRKMQLANRAVVTITRHLPAVVREADKLIDGQ